MSQVITPSKTQTVFKESFVHISFDAQNRIIYAKWIGFLKLEDTKRACRVLIDFIKQNRVTLHLSEQTELKVLSKEVQEYLAGTCFPELDQNGIRRVAVLLSEDIFAQATVSNVNTKATVNKLQINTFGSAQKAHDWLTA
jgi:poly(A) polymerase Pap1